MAISVNLNYTSYLPEPPVSELTFNTPGSAVINQNKRYLRATSPDTSTPILLSSSDDTLAVVNLEDNYWSVDFKAAGTVTLTASQGSTVVSKVVTISDKEVPTGRVFNVGTGSGFLEIDENMGLISGDTVIIAPGKYSGISIVNVKISDGLAPVTIRSNGLVEVAGDFNNFNFRHLRNVVIDGGCTEGVKYGFLCRDNIYQGIYLEDINYLTIRNLEIRNIYNTGWNWEGLGNAIYDGSESSYQKGNRFINIKSDNAGSFNTGGGLDANNEHQITGLVEGLVFENWEIENSSADSLIYIGCGQNIMFKNIHVNHVNTLNNNHNGVFFCSGTADVVNCSVKNFEGNLIRLWSWTLIDGNIGGRVSPKKCLLYGNTAFSSRKYGFFEIQSFERYIIPGLTSYADADIFHNTGANMNLNIPTVFTGTLLDNYYLWGGTVRCFNNVLINPVNEGSNNIYLTYSSSAIGGTETQSGDTQEFNNRVFYSLESSGISPSSLALKHDLNNPGGAIINSSTDLYAADYYGNPKAGYIGAIQVKEMKMGTQSGPTVPDISEWFDMLDDGSANNFQVTAKRSVSSAGIKNYDVDRNGIIFTTRGGFCRDGKQDPEFASSFTAGEVLQWRFRARDFKDQVSAWSDRFVHIMPGAVYSSSPVTLTKTSGGTLINNNNIYEAADDTVFCSTGISVGPDESVRIIFDNVMELGAHFPYIGWAEASQITNINEIRAGVHSGGGDLNNALIIKDGFERSIEYFNEGAPFFSLHIHYDGYSWFKVSPNEVNWYNIGTQRNKHTQIIDGPNQNMKFVVVALPLGCKLSNPRLITYPGSVL